MNAESQKQSSYQEVLVIEPPDPSLFDQQRRAEEHEKIQLVEQQKVQARLEEEARKERERAAQVVSAGVEAETKKADSASEKFKEQSTASAQKTAPYSSYKSYSQASTGSYSSYTQSPAGTYSSRYGVQSSVEPAKPKKPGAQKAAEIIFGAIGESAAEIRIERISFSHPHGKRIYEPMKSGGLLSRVSRSVSTNPRKERAFYKNALVALKVTKIAMAFGISMLAKDVFYIKK